MHFFDRTLCTNPPTLILAKLDVAERPKWLSYKAYLANKALPAVSEPSSRWNRITIKKPLVNFFLFNCAYCGIYTHDSHQGEVDHLLPKSKNSDASKIYSWDNYVWACHSCNHKKSSNYPVLNPCIKTETDSIEFSIITGQYRLKPTIDADLKLKFELTNTFTFINGNKNCERRKLIFEKLNNFYLPKLKTHFAICESEKSTNPLSPEYKSSKIEIDRSIKEIEDIISYGDFLKFIKQIYTEFKKINLLPIEAHNLFNTIP